MSQKGSVMSPIDLSRRSVSLLDGRICISSKNRCIILAGQVSEAAANGQRITEHFCPIKVDELAKSHEGDSTVRRSRCKAPEFSGMRRT
jgi:hypothetical protein